MDGWVGRDDVCDEDVYLWDVLDLAVDWGERLLLWE